MENTGFLQTSTLGLRSSDEKQFKFFTYFVDIFGPTDVNESTPYPRPFPLANQLDIWHDDRKRLYLFILIWSFAKLIN